MRMVDCAVVWGDIGTQIGKSGTLIEKARREFQNAEHSIFFNGRTMREGTCLSRDDMGRWTRYCRARTRLI